MDMNNRVFIVKIPEFFDTDGRWKPKFVPRGAEKFGTVKLLIPSGQHLIEEEFQSIKLGLEDFTENDYLILMGSPIQMGLATHIAMKRTGGKVQFLNWNRKRNGGEYDIVIININNL